MSSNRISLPVRLKMAAVRCAFEGAVYTNKITLPVVEAAHKLFCHIPIRVELSALTLPSCKIQQVGSADSYATYIRYNGCPVPVICRPTVTCFPDQIIPQNVTAVISDCCTREVTISWDAITCDGTTEYTAEYALTGTEMWTELSPTTSNSSTFIGTEGETYDVRVQANCGGCISLYSLIAQIYVPCPLTQAIEFDGVNDKGRISSADFTGADFNAVADSLSLSFWIQQLSIPSSGINDAVSIGILGSGEDRRINFRFLDTGIILIVVRDSVNLKQLPLSGFSDIMTRQLHVIYQREATGYRIYVDGVPVDNLNTDSFSRTSTTTTNPNSVSVGTNVTDGLGFCNIRVSDFLAIDGQFTPKDITRLYNGGCGDACYTPVGGQLLWRILFDQPTNPQTDISGNGRDMTMSGFPSPIAPVNGPCP